MFTPCFTYRLELQQFLFPEPGRNGVCKTGRLTISGVVGGRVKTMQDICGNKEGVEGRTDK